MFERLFDKVVNEQQPAPARPKPVTPSIPKTPTEEPYRKPKSPIKPTPGKHPKPKARSNIDIELFKKARSGMNEMAFDPGRFPDFVHPTRKSWIETGDEQLDALFPKLTKGEQSYLEMITSKTYQEMVARLEKYTGVQGRGAMPALLGVLAEALNKVFEVEASHIDELEKLALEVVLELPEYKMVKNAYEEGEVDFDIKLGKPELNVDMDTEADEGELSPAEEMNLDLTDELEGVDEAMLRRRLANLLTQGSATLKTYLFNMVSKRLTEIDSDLPNLYGLLAVAAQIGYWIFPPEFAEATEAGVGSEEVIPEGDEYTIKVRAVAFPYLVHELVKGITEWLSLTEEGGHAEVDTMKKEAEDIIAGPELYKMLSSYVDKQELMPLVQKKFLQLPRDEVKDVLAKNARGESIMRRLVRDASNEWRVYQEEKKQSDIEAAGL
jgi:hypothetical protein